MRMEHVALYVRDLERAKDFFIRYFGATADPCYHNPRTNFRSYFLRFADGARLEIMHKPLPEEAPALQERMGYAHVAFSVGSAQVVDVLTETLRADGYAVLSGPRTTGDGYYESCIADLEGNRIEITV